MSISRGDVFYNRTIYTYKYYIGLGKARTTALLKSSTKGILSSKAILSSRIKEQNSIYVHSDEFSKHCAELLLKVYYALGPF